MPALLVAVAVIELVPKPSGTLAVQVAKLLELVAITLFTFTEMAPELVPWTVLIAVAVELPVVGLVITIVGAEVS